MHISFKQGLDKFDSKNYPNIEPEEIDLLLNQAQDAFVKTRYSYNNSKKEPFEAIQKRTEDLKNVVVRDNFNTSAIVSTAYNINVYSIFVPLPQDHWITIQELCTVITLDCNGVPKAPIDIFVLAIQHNDYSKLIDNPFTKPTDGKVLRLMGRDGVELIPSPTSQITNYKLTYIKKPVRIYYDQTGTSSVDCELSEHTHQEIINASISIALENIEAQRIKTFIQVTEARQE